MAIRELLAQHLARLIREQGKPKAQIAKELGYTRQRLYQLETADRSALPEAIEDAINKLGYEVNGLDVKRKEEKA
jgi:transcriptional regulator